MKKTYILEGLDCANCAARVEAKFNGHPAVEEAVITFATAQLRLTAEDPDSLIPELTALGRTVEAGFTICPRGEREHPRHHHHDHDHECGCGHPHDHDHECGCGHPHGHDHECSCGHDHSHPHDPAESPVPLAAGGVLFVLGLALSHWDLTLPALGVCLIAYGLLGLGVLKTALGNLVKGHVFDENFLMSIATLGAFCIGEFPEAVGVMLFYRVGEYFEHRAVERSRRQILEAMDLRPETIRLVRGEYIREAGPEEAVVGDTFLVRPGERIPLDGVVLSGESFLDTAPISGEPVPVRVRPGDKVTSGCINTQGQLKVRVEKVLSESMVTRILDSLENAAAGKPKIDRFITRFARIYTPAVVAIAAATAVIPSLITGHWSYWVYTALTFLVMSCPCALVLSVPLAFFAGIGVGGRQGILFKGGQSMEALTRIRAVILDKTGTLTRGDFRVQKVLGEEGLLALCASAEQHSSHPIARSIVSAARERGLGLSRPQSLEELPGLGIRAVVEGRTLLCGSPRLLEGEGIAFDPPPETGTLVLAAVDGQYAGCLVIADTLKPGAPQAVEELNRRGLHTVMLTGDNPETAEAVARQVGIREVHSRLLPQGKLQLLTGVRSRFGPVLFVGDGINDAPVLTGADVGAAMGSGADMAIEAADVVFLTSQPEAIGTALDIARSTQAIAWQNVIFALGIKLVVMVLGLLGHASMWLAVFADSGVAMLCVLNAIRLLYRKRET